MEKMFTNFPPCGLIGKEIEYVILREVNEKQRLEKV